MRDEAEDALDRIASVFAAARPAQADEFLIDGRLQDVYDDASQIYKYPYIPSWPPKLLLVKVARKALRLLLMPQVEFNRAVRDVFGQLRQSRLRDTAAQAETRALIRDLERQVQELSQKLESIGQDAAARLSSAIQSGGEALHTEIAAAEQAIGARVVDGPDLRPGRPLRIAVDLHGLQSAGSTTRGIGRYVRGLLEPLLAQPGDTEFILFANGCLPAPELTLPAGMQIHTIPFRPGGLSEFNSLLYKTVLLQADVDAVFLPSPIEQFNSVIPDLTDFPSKLIVVWHDLVPLLFPEKYLTDMNVRANYMWALRNVRKADMLFANSEATRQDAIWHLDVPDEASVNIGAGASTFFAPIAKADEALWRAQFARRHGIVRPFVMNTGGAEWRKNVEGLIRGFAALPPEIRKRYQLVVAFRFTKPGADALRALAREEGLAPDALVLTGFVSDDELRALYSLCDLFVFPSFYEGFGLPLVEAIACGAPAIAANDSSLPEIVSDPECLFDPNSPSSIADCMLRILGDESLRLSYREEAPLLASGFRWDAVADKAHAFLRQNPPVRPAATFTLRRIRSVENHHDAPSNIRAGIEGKGRLAFCVPLLPLLSASTASSEDLLPALAKNYAIDLIVDDNDSPSPQSTFGLRYRRFRTLVGPDDGGHDYRAIIYRLTNSVDCSYMYALLQHSAGITVLQDYDLGRLLHDADRLRPDLDISFRGELEFACGRSRASEFMTGLAQKRLTIDDLASEGISVNRRVFTRSVGIILTNQRDYDRAVSEHADVCAHIACIPDDDMEHSARLYSEFIETVMHSKATRQKLIADYIGRGLALLDEPAPQFAELIAPFEQAGVAGLRPAGADK